MATTRDPHTIDWPDVAARARADLGDERVERVSARLRATVMAEISVRPGELEGFQFGVATSSLDR